MTRNMKTAIILRGFSGILSSCLSPNIETKTVSRQATQQANNSQKENNQLVEGNVDEYTLPVAEEQKADYKKALYNHPKSFSAMNFYAQFLCQVKYNFNVAQELFDKALYFSYHNNMEDTLFLYSECITKQNRKAESLRLMVREDKFRVIAITTQFRLAEMYFEDKRYKECYKIIYGMRNNKAFFNNKKILELILKLAEYAHNKDEAATVGLVFSSNYFNDDTMNKFFADANNGDTSE